MNRSIKVLVMAALAVAGVATTMVTGAPSASAQEYVLDACLQGYVWREAMASDHVCVTPVTRSQAWSDNAQAANRRASFNIWITRWYSTAAVKAAVSLPPAVHT